MFQDTKIQQYINNILSDEKRFGYAQKSPDNMKNNLRPLRRFPPEPLDLAPLCVHSKSQKTSFH